MKYQLFHATLVLMAILMGCTPPGCLAAASTYTYSLSADFTNGAINAPQLGSDVQRDFRNVSLIDVVVTGDVVDINFQWPLSDAHQRVLDRYVYSHNSATLLNQFCADLPDRDLQLTNAMVKLGVLVSTCTKAVSYSFLNATAMVDSRVSSGKFWLINDGTGEATLAMGTGGSTNHNMVVLPGTKAKFLYTVTNNIAGSHAYLVMRVV